VDKMRTTTRIKIYLRSKLLFLVKVQQFLYKFKTYRAKFRAYYLDNGWNNLETLSGSGSTLRATRAVRRQLPQLLETYKIHTVVDIPCGDFNWLKEVNLDGIDYLGIDIVKEMINSNISKYRRKNINFKCADLMNDKLPRADLIICRDCLIHYSTKYVFKAFKNMRASRSTYLLSTTYTEVDINTEIKAVGLFRPINLAQHPFNFPQPLFIFDEDGDNGKSLGLWRFSDILEGSGAHERAPVAHHH